jgi:hypothetical protein
LETALSLPMLEYSLAQTFMLALIFHFLLERIASERVVDAALPVAGISFSGLT